MGVRKWKSLDACGCTVHSCSKDFVNSCLLTTPLLSIHAHTHMRIFQPEAITGGRVFKIGVVADQDENSMVSTKTWHSFFMTGSLTLHDDHSISVSWDAKRTELQTHVAEKGRGAELSELVVFNGKLYTVDDRTGIGEWRRSRGGGALG